MQQNYIRQLNQFHLWLEQHYLPPHAELLWFHLIGLFNRCGWAEWVPIDARKLMSMAGVDTPKSAYRTRDALVNAGLLEYQKGKKGCPTRYRMRYFPCPQNTEYDTENDTENVTENVTENGTNATQETSHTYKLKEKEKENKKQNVVQEKQAKEFPVPEDLRSAWRSYCAMLAQKGRPMTQADAQKALDKLQTLCPDDVSGQSVILTQSTMYRVEGLYPVGKIPLGM